MKDKPRKVVDRPVSPFAPRYPLRISENIVTRMNRQLLRHVDDPARGIREIDANPNRVGF